MQTLHSADTLHTRPHPVTKHRGHAPCTQPHPSSTQTHISHTSRSPPANKHLRLRGHNPSTNPSHRVVTTHTHPYRHTPCTHLVCGWHSCTHLQPQLCTLPVAQQPADRAHAHSPMGPGLPLPPAPPGQAPAGKKAASPCASPPDISPSTHPPFPLPSAHPAPSGPSAVSAPDVPKKGCAAGPHLGGQRCPAPQADHGQQEAEAGQRQAQAQRERDQQGGARLPPAPPPPLAPTGGHGGGGLCLPHRPPIPGPEGSGEGEPAGGSGWGEGGARETGREGALGTGSRTLCVIKLRASGWALCVQQTEWAPTRPPSAQPGRAPPGRGPLCAAAAATGLCVCRHLLRGGGELRKACWFRFFRVPVSSAIRTLLSSRCREGTSERRLLFAASGKGQGVPGCRTWFREEGQETVRKILRLLRFSQIPSAENTHYDEVHRLG